MVKGLRGRGLCSSPEARPESARWRRSAPRVWRPQTRTRPQLRPPPTSWQVWAAWKPPFPPSRAADSWPVRHPLPFWPTLYTFLVRSVVSLNLHRPGYVLTLPELCCRQSVIHNPPENSNISGELYLSFTWRTGLTRSQSERSSAANHPQEGGARGKMLKFNLTFKMQYTCIWFV